MNSDKKKKLEVLKSQNKKLLLEVSLFLNNELFKENIISYKMFSYAEDGILKELNNTSI